MVGIDATVVRAVVSETSKTQPRHNVSETSCVVSETSSCCDGLLCLAHRHVTPQPGLVIFFIPVRGRYAPD